MRMRHGGRLGMDRRGGSRMERGRRQARGLGGEKWRETGGFGDVDRRGEGCESGKGGG
jgi:hypothetical protein